MLFFFIFNYINETEKLRACLGQNYLFNEISHKQGRGESSLIVNGKFN